jgi:prevent-host-death family protein
VEEARSLDTSAKPPILAKIDALEKPMKTMTAAQAKNSFGQFLDFAQREPVLVTKQNRPVGVFISMQDLEDTVLGERALRAHAEGYLGPEKSRKFLDGLLAG